ncbi:lipoprotein LpqH [Mycobacterium sp. pUA109]|uniref:lipoprotein LpqH n=1 Tax=Mycobacterium sp. pUA109 TaxID=3238982 RepID=UPI00351B25C6
MRNRFVAATLIVGLAAVAGSGCYGQSKSLPQKTAHITVDGNSRTSHAISCTQVQSLLTVEIGVAPGRVRALLELQPDKPIPQTVDIENFNGFHGVANAGAGKAQATFRDSTYTITGTAEGTDPDHPDRAKAASFQIETQC